MKCPVCNAAISGDAVVCNSCGAIKTTQRTNLGIFVGWVGMTIAILWAMLWSGLLILPFTQHGLNEFPWLTLIIGTVIAAGMLWYSRQTRHTVWVRQEG